MKSFKFLFTTILIFSIGISFAQPWFQSGANSGALGTFFGTSDNYAVLTITEGTIRGFMNPNRFAAINGFLGVNTSGFYGLGPNNLMMSGNPNLWDDVGPFYRLHINSDMNPTGVQELGYRPWMRNGIGLIGNSDNFY